jgi:hypothetical protein
MKWRRSVVAVLCLCGCAGGQSPAPQSTGEEPVEKPAFMRDCDLYAEAPVEIGYEDITGGAAVLYRTSGNVARLRERTQEVAKFHSGTQGKSRWLHDLRAIPHHATAEDIEGGAKLLLVSDRARPAYQDSLRKNVQQEVWTMQKKGCGAGREAL